VERKGLPHEKNKKQEAAPGSPRVGARIKFSRFVKESRVWSKFYKTILMF
jgi:hypothetical protein